MLDSSTLDVSRPIACVRSTRREAYADDVDSSVFTSSFFGTQL